MRFEALPESCWTVFDGPLTAEQETQVRFIQGSAEELTEMVNDLLDLAKVEAGRITVSPAWFDLVDLFSALRGMFKPIVTSESVKLIFVEATGIPRIYNDDPKSRTDSAKLYFQCTRSSRKKVKSVFRQDVTATVLSSSPCRIRGLELPKNIMGHYSRTLFKSIHPFKSDCEERDWDFH